MFQDSPWQAASLNRVLATLLQPPQPPPDQPQPTASLGSCGAAPTCCSHMTCHDALEEDLHDTASSTGGAGPAAGAGDARPHANASLHTTAAAANPCLDASCCLPLRRVPKRRRLCYDAGQDQQHTPSAAVAPSRSAAAAEAQADAAAAGAAATQAFLDIMEAQMVTPQHQAFLARWGLPVATSVPVPPIALGGCNWGGGGV